MALQERFEIMPLHKVFLNPKFKSMAVLGNPEREEVVALLKCLLQILNACLCSEK